jgi:hypothetical protein
VSAVRLSEAVRTRDDGVELVGELRSLIEAHRATGSARAEVLIGTNALPLEDIWLVEAVPATDAAATLATRQPGMPARAAAGAGDAVASAV